jgi:uncharacterized protein YegL
MALIKKLVIMALLGALGAALGAVLGELLFLGEPEPPRPNPRNISLLFDLSGSMSAKVDGTVHEEAQSQLEVLKVAARDFVERQDLSHDAFGLAVFATSADVVNDLGHDAAALQASISALDAEGATNLGRGLEAAATMLRAADGERWILLFSDGKPGGFKGAISPELAALNAATKARAEGIHIVAIGTGLADAQLLSQITGTPENVIISDPNALAEAFRQSESVINKGQMLASQRSTETFQHSVLKTGVWAGLIAIGAGLGLLVGQNRHLRRGALRIWETIVVVVGGVVTGLVAGAAGQASYYVLADFPTVVEGGRVLAWALLGLGIGFGMGSFVPNLKRRRAAIAGAVGGMIAGLCFLKLVAEVGDPLSRLLGAIILGLAAGLTMVLVEAAYRKGWLVVHWSEKEHSTLTLGTTPILVGSSSKVDVLLADQDSPAAVMAEITLTDGVVRLQDGQTQSVRTLNDGEILTYGRTRLEVRASAGGAADSPDPESVDDGRADSTTRTPRGFRVGARA